MREQSKLLSMFGIRTTNHPQLKDGVHLRWFFDPVLGFPKYGFRLFRGYRKSSESQPLCYPKPKESWEEQDVSKDSILPAAALRFHFGGHTKISKQGILLKSDLLGIEASEPCKQMDLDIHLISSSPLDPPKKIDPNQPYKSVRPIKNDQSNIPNKQITPIQPIKPMDPNDKKDPINPKEPIKIIEQPPRIEVWIENEKGETIKEVHTLETKRTMIRLQADHLKSIKCRVVHHTKVISSNRVILSRVCWSTVSSSVKEYGWETIGEFQLPDTWDEAETNIIEPNDMRNHKETFNQEIQSYIKRVKESYPSPQSEVVVEETDGRNGSPEKNEMSPVNIHPLHWILTASLYPDMAQILGLYGFDDGTKGYHQPPEEGEVLYRLEGYWNKNGLISYRSEEEKREEMYEILISGKHPYGTRMERYGWHTKNFHFLAREGIQFYQANGKKTARVSGLFDIYCPRDMAMLRLHIQQVGHRPVHIRCEKSDGSWTHHTLDTMHEMEDFDAGIRYIRITGDFEFQGLLYADMNYAWVTFYQPVADDHQISPPKDLKPTLLPGHGAAKDGKNHSYGTIGLTWRMPDDPLQISSVNINGTKIIESRILPQHMPIFCKLERAKMNERNGNDPLPFHALNHDHPVLIPYKQLKNEEIPFLYMDSGDRTEEGEMIQPLQNMALYIYRAKSMDLFGRESTYTESQKIQIDHEERPIPPAIQSAKVLHPSQPNMDHLEHAWTNQHGKGMRFTWLWPDHYAQQSPDVQAFRVYLSPTRFNLWQGQIIHVDHVYTGLDLKGHITEKNTDEVKIKVTGSVDQALHHLAGNDLKRGKEFYRVDSVLSSMTNQDHTMIHLRIAERFEDLQAGDSVRLDVSYTVLDVLFSGKKPLAADQMAHRILRQTGKNFRIMTNQTAESIIEEGIEKTKVRFRVEHLPLPPKEAPDPDQRVSLSIEPNDEVYVDPTDPASWKVGGQQWLLEIPINKGAAHERGFIFDPFLKEEDIPDLLRLTPMSNQPVIDGQVGISSIDSFGKESAIATIPVQAILFDQPDQPTVPDLSSLWSTIPDGEGHSSFPLKGSNEENMHLYQQVYRTTDQMLWQVDREEHRNTGHLDDQGMPVMEICQRLWRDADVRAHEIKKDLQTLDQAIQHWDSSDPDKKQRRLKDLLRKYDALRADTCQYLATLTQNERAFRAVSPPLDFRKQNHDSNGEKQYIDTIVGKSRNVYFYRLKASDHAGNRSELGLSTLPIRVPDTILPKPPHMTKVSGGNRQSVFRWKRNHEPGIVRYEIYRTHRKEAAADIRMMGEPVAIIDGDTSGKPLKAKVINDDAFVDLYFQPAADQINRVQFTESESIEADPLFDGFVSLLLNVNIDEGKVNVHVGNPHDENIQTIQSRIIDGQVRLGPDQLQTPVSTVNGVYKESDVTNTHNLFTGIASGRIKLTTPSHSGETTDSDAKVEMIKHLKEQDLKISYTNQEQGSHELTHVTHELEWIDQELEAGTYYYRLIVVRNGIIGEENDQLYTIPLSSHPTKALPVSIIDTSPPEPPTWLRVAWIMVDQDGNEHHPDMVDDMDDDVELHSAVVLEWQADGQISSYQVEKRAYGSMVWKTVTSLDGEQQHYVDQEVTHTESYEYRVKGKRTNGLEAKSDPYVLD